MCGTPKSSLIIVTCSADHGLVDDDIVLFSSTTIPGGSSLSATTFDDVKFMVTSVPTSTTFTITLPANVTGTTLASNNTSTTIQIYYSKHYDAHDFSIVIASQPQNHQQITFSP